MKLFGENLDDAYRNGAEWLPVQTESWLPNIEFERYVQRDTGFRKKKYLIEDHDVRLMNADFTGAPSPADYYDLMCKHLKDDIDDPILESVVKDMFDGTWEFTDCAIQYTGTHFHLYMDVNSMIYSEDKKHYIVPTGSDWYKGFAVAQFDSLRVDSITKGGAWVDFETLFDAMPEFMMSIIGKDYSELPLEMQLGKSKSRMYIPADAYIWPLTFGDIGNDKYSLHIARQYAASRGVKEL